jgi:hypothetical protein
VKCRGKNCSRRRKQAEVVRKERLYTTSRTLLYTLMSHLSSPLRATAEMIPATFDSRAQDAGLVLLPTF